MSYSPKSIQRALLLAKAIGALHLTMPSASATATATEPLNFDILESYVELYVPPFDELDEALTDPKNAGLAILIKNAKAGDAESQFQAAVCLRDILGCAHRTELISNYAKKKCL